MSCVMIPFTRCKFCADAGQGGELFLDPHAVWELYSKRKEWGPAPDNLRQIIKHDSPRTGIGVCPHLIDIDMVVERCELDSNGNDIAEWEIHTSWVHPLFDEVCHGLIPEPSRSEAEQSLLHRSGFFLRSCEVAVMRVEADADVLSLVVLIEVEFVVLVRLLFVLQNPAHFECL